MHLYIIDAVMVKLIILVCRNNYVRQRAADGNSKSSLERGTVLISEDSITSFHTHFFELKMAVCACVCVHCWWIKTTVADGVSEWEAGKEESRSSHSFVCFSSVCSKKCLISLLLSQTDQNNHCSRSIHTENTNIHVHS